MAEQAPEQFNMLALALTGDLGALTIYTTRRNKIVWFPKAPPLKPPSPSQIVIRERWRRAASEWKQLSVFNRRSWELIVQRAGLRITGYNFFISLFVHPDQEARLTVERLAGESFPT